MPQPLSDGKWWEELVFWVHPEAQPGMQLVRVGFKNESQTCRFLVGPEDKGVAGWKRRCEFWVPW